MKDKKILIINAMGIYNYGGRAVIKGAIRSLQENIPNVKIYIMSTHYKSERSTYEKWNYENVELIDHIWYNEDSSYVKNVLYSCVCASIAFLKFMSYRCFHKILPIKNPYYQYDIIIDLTTDGPNDHYGLIMPIFFMYNTFLAIISGKTIVICAASIGKFDKLATKLLAKFILSNVDLITVREDITREYLQTLNISGPRIELTADHAFLMKPSNVQRIDEIFLIEGINEDDRPIIGISPSQLIHKYAFSNIYDKGIKYKEYISVMADVVDFLIEYLNSTVILIPHSSPAPTMVSDENDLSVSKDIYALSKNKNRLMLITGEYDADDLKGIIGKCDMFIGCRMHSTIASSSMEVPTIAVVYGHKSHGIIGKMMGQEKCIVEIGNYSPDEFLSEMRSKINYVWNNRHVITNELKEKTKIVKERALLNGKLIKELMLSLDE